MFREIYVKQLTEYFQTFEYEELKDYIPYIETYFMNEKYTEEQLAHYVKVLSQPSDMIKEWSDRKKDRDDNNQKNIEMFLRFIDNNADIWKDKKVFFLTVYEGEVVSRIAKHGGKVAIYDRYNASMCDTVLNAIKDDVYITTFSRLDPRLPNFCDYVIGFQCFSDPVSLEAYWNYLQRMEKEGKTVYIVSTRIFEGSHPIIKLDKKPNIVYNENIDGIERVVFNGIQTEA